MPRSDNNDNVLDRITKIQVIVEFFIMGNI